MLEDCMGCGKEILEQGKRERGSRELEEGQAAELNREGLSE